MKTGQRNSQSLSLRHLLHYARQGIRQDRQRALIAILAVAFGVMSLIGMSTVSEAISSVLLIGPRYEIGGDAWLWRESEFLSRADLDQIEAFAETGEIDRWAPVVDTPTLILKVPGSGRVTFLRDGVGFEPGTYPMVGEIVLRSGLPLDRALRQPGDLVITKDVADARDLHTGDTVLIGSQLGGNADPYRITGIAVQTPAYHGSTIYFDLTTAPQLMNHPEPITNVAVAWEGLGGAARAELEASGWHVFAPDTVSERSRQIWSTFDMMLKGAGILGLMVGGIGIANTMQVLLAGRREEVAVLKTLGYARRDVMRIFITETSLIGIAGSLLGAALGIGLSVLLVRIASNIVTLFINWQFHPELVGGGIAIGIVTTVLFAADAIMQASGVRPADVFRQLPVSPRRRLRSLFTFGAMAVPFGAITILIMGSVWKGIAILGIALAGLLLVGGLLAGIKWLVVRLLPTFNLHLLRMARNHLRRRGFSMVFAMIALFIGSFTLGISMTILQGITREYKARTLRTDGYNLVVMTDPAWVGDAHEAVKALSDRTGVRYEVRPEMITTSGGEDLAERLGSVSLQGRELLWDVSVTGAPWSTVEHAAYLPANRELNLPEGTELTVTGFNGESMTLTVAGTYSANGQWDRSLLPQPEGILVSAETLRTFGREDAVALAAAEVPAQALDASAQQIGADVPAMMVITANDVNESFQSTVRNLSTFAVAMAGLALLAGTVLIANAVSLAMIRRRYEIGVMKATGYSRGQVLRTLLFEYGLVGTIASGLGLLGVIAFTIILPRLQEVTDDVLTLGPGLSLVIVGSAMGLTLLAALSAAWRPTSLRPAVVLNEGG
jgi:putative ABC transport system permease protein